MFMVKTLGYRYLLRADLYLEGEDATDFLQSQFTNDLRPFDCGRCTYGLWLDVKGRVQADAYVLQTGATSFRLISEHSAGESIRSHLEHHIIADDVQIDSISGRSFGLSLIGADAVGILRDLSIEVPDAGNWAGTEHLAVFSGRRSGEVNFECIFKREDDYTAVCGKLELAGVRFVSDDVIDFERIAAGYPLVPKELGPGDLPGEAGMAGDAVSLNKGCYLGQEVVARMHHVGQPRRSLYIIEGEGSPPVLPADLLGTDGRVAGSLRTVIDKKDGWRGVAMLKLRSIDRGDSLRLNDEAVEIVRALRVAE